MDQPGKPNKPVPEPAMDQPGKPNKSVKNKTKSRRGYGKKNGRKTNKGLKNAQFTLLGSNSAGLNCKKYFFFILINKHRPSVITIQESKLSKPGMIRIPGYQTFERVCTGKRGGGLLTAADEDLYWKR